MIFKHLCLGSLIGLVASAYLIQLSPEEGIVPRGVLLKAQGTVVKVVTRKESFRFELSDNNRVFSYPEKSGADGMVKRALREAGATPVTVLYDSNARKSTFRNNTRYHVWEVYVGDRPVRTYNEIASAWRHDNRMLSRLGFALIFISLIFAFAAWWVFRQDCGSDS